MQNEDLQQIKKIIDESLEKKLEEKLEQKLEKFKDEIVTTTKQQFDENTQELKVIYTELQKRPTREDFSGWRDKQVEPIRSDVDKLKFLHKNEWKGLPDSGTVSRVLVEEGIKS